MAVLRFEYEVEMDDGTAYDVVIDQRDVAAWEVQEFAVPFARIGERVNLFMRWTAWRALSQRYGTYGGSWNEFNEHCVEVRDLPDSEGDGKADPTRPDRSAAT